MVTPAAAWGVLVVWAELLGGRVAPVGGARVFTAVYQSVLGQDFFHLLSALVCVGGELGFSEHNNIRVGWMCELLKGH